MPLPQDTAEFVRRWRDKRTSYGDDRLEDVFDRFFTSLCYTISSTSGLH